MYDQLIKKSVRSGLCNTNLGINMARYIRIIVCLIAVPLPSFLKVILFRHLFGAILNKGVKIGFSFIDVKSLEMGESARIGNFNLIRNLDLLRLGEHSKIGNLNKVSALRSGSTRHFRSQERLPALILGAHATVTGRHFFDCCDRIEIGDLTTIAGRECCFYTHGIDISKSVQSCGSIVIGRACLVGTRCVVVKNSVLPDCSVLGAMSMLTGSQTQPYSLYSGVPAMPVRQLREDSLYFSRSDRDVK